MWQGDYSFIIRQLVLKDFRVRYRNMSLGVFWSLLNPLIMLGVLSFVFTKIFTNTQPHYALYILCGLVPYNFFAIAWQSATVSIVENAVLIKRVPVHREIIPISTVLGNLLHLGIQMALLTVAAFYYGVGANIHWLWLPVIWGLELVFIFGLVLITSSLNVFIRDIRYVVESGNVILFWLVPIFYSFEMVPQDFKSLFEYNPVAALVLASRKVILDAQAPPTQLMMKLTAVALFSLILGEIVFRRLKNRFYPYL